MNKVWETIIDIFVGILIMFISVTIYFGLKTETVMKSMYENITDEFVTGVKKNGEITLSDYEKFMERMGIGHNLFAIKFEHKYKVLEPEYRFKTLEEILNENKYTGPNEYHYKDVITEKPHVDDPINDGNLNTETNESILKKAKDISADPNHIHDEGCYTGHKHTGEPYFIHTHKHTSACRLYDMQRFAVILCNDCNRESMDLIASWTWNPETNSAELISYSFPVCRLCGSRSVRTLETKNNRAYSCGYNIDTDGDGFYNEEAGRDKAYDYKVSYPLNQNSATYVSGCYTYHQEKKLGYSRDNKTSVKIAFEEMMWDDFEGYCEIPEYISIGISTNDYKEKSYAHDTPNLCYVTYQSYLSSNGKIRFKYNSYFRLRSTSDQIGERGTDNPGFPADISVQEFQSYYNNKGIIAKWFKNIFGIDYTSRFGSNVSFHLTWVSCTYSGYHKDNREITSFIHVCGFDHSLGVNRWITTCGFEEDGTVFCNQIIVSLVPTHPEQTVYINDPLITTAVATYKDGSTKTIVCTTDFTTSQIGKDQDVILTYKYTINGKSYSKSCNIKVTVIPRNKTCPKGHTYNLNPDGTDPGCPYCKAWIESLRVIYPTTSPIVITIGTTLQDNGVKLLATYMDGHTEEVTSGYIDNLDNKYLGTKPVTIGYKGASVTVLVTTKCATIICDICGYEYELWPDGTNPGCPRCIQKIPVFTGNIMEYEHINHTQEILESLYQKGKYVFNDNDIFKISIRNKSTNIARMLLKKVYPSISDTWFIFEKSEYIKAK